MSTRLWLPSSGGDIATTRAPERTRLWLPDSSLLTARELEKIGLRSARNPESVPPNPGYADPLTGTPYADVPDFPPPNFDPRAQAGFQQPFQTPQQISATRPSLVVRGGGAHVVSAGAAGQNAWVFLFNESTFGEILYIRGVQTFVTGNSFVYFEVIQGPLPAGVVRFAEPATVATPEGAVDPRVGKPSGQMFTLSALTPLTPLPNFVGGVNFTGQGVSWQDNPIAVIPPGFSFVIQVKNVALTFEGAVVWIGVRPF